MNNSPETAKESKRSLWTTAGLGVSAVTLVVCVIYDPGKAFDATLQGLSVWWHIVFPALMPFLMLSEMMMAYGLVHGLGTLFEPLTRRMLRFPGESGYLLPLGLIAGFPVSAEAAAKLHAQGKLSGSEASRIAAVSHFCNPMLLIVVIGTGFMHTPALGVLLAAVHAAAGLAAGATLGWFNRPAPSRAAGLAQDRSSHPDNGSRRSTPNSLQQGSRKPGSLFQQTVRSIENARRLDGRSFGRLLGDTVTASVQTLFTVGGYMLIFALVIEVVSRFLPGPFPGYLLPALLEVHLGSFRLAEPDVLSPAVQAALLGAALGWGGLCSYFQVRAVLKPSGITSKGFLTARLLHAAYAYVLTLLLWKPVTSLFPNTLPAYRDLNAGGGIQTSGALPAGLTLPGWDQAWGMLGWQSAALAVLLSGLAAFSFIWRRRLRRN
ncbi:nucleoside recognition domain-containing protein [Paenibacillus pinistramenti]|uniref:nucleoside recognition domain-containing protein n=1 Tax=Paenibacillus pinistramenti TaxID=1768003 RepID=UPI00193A89A8|nr:nucleoside recognition domain-containing protein [Paenibacillus pinistramenti]